MPNLSRQEAEKVIATLAIPPRPTVVTGMMEEQSRDEPDLGRIAQLIASDVGISAAVLKTVNSPLYGLKRKATSIDQAVSMLGLNNVAALVTSLTLRHSIPADGLDRFWDEAARTALLMAFLAQYLGNVPREEAYMFGLFHDCGIPLLVTRFPNYKETLRLANAAMERDFTAVEDERHHTNHAVVGGLLAANWHLPRHLRDAIRLHHDLQAFQSGASEATLNLIALIQLAEHLENLYARRANDSEWSKMGEAAQAYLLVGEREMADLSKDAGDLLQELDS